MLVYGLGGFWAFRWAFLALFATWADLMFCGILSSKPGGKRGPEDEEEEGWCLGLLNGPNLLAIEIGNNDEFCIGLFGGDGPFVARLGITGWVWFGDATDILTFAESSEESGVVFPRLWSSDCRPLMMGSLLALWSRELMWFS